MVLSYRKAIEVYTGGKNVLQLKKYDINLLYNRYLWLVKIKHDMTHAQAVQRD